MSTQQASKQLAKALELARIAESSRGQLLYEQDIRCLYKVIRKHPEVRKQVVAERPLLECDLSLLELARREREDNIARAKQVAAMGEKFGKDILVRLRRQLKRDEAL